MRVGVTGSRDYPDRRRVYQVLTTEVAEPYFRKGYDSDGIFIDYLVPHDFTLVVGDCPDGPDAWATDWMIGFDRMPEIHHAKWNEFGRAAGPIRNAEMVNAGADLWLAFISPCVGPHCKTRRPHGSHGATGCANLAQRAGIETKRYYA